MIKNEGSLARGDEIRDSRTMDRRFEGEEWRFRERGARNEEHGVGERFRDLVDSDIGCRNGMVTPRGDIHFEEDCQRMTETCISCGGGREGSVSLSAKNRRRASYQVI